MSFFSDLFEGNFGNLGTDIEHAPTSLLNNPTELDETLGVVGLGLGGLGLAGALGAFGADAGLAADTGLAADLGLSTADAGGTAAAAAGGDAALANDIGALTLGSADTAIAPEAVAGGDLTASAIPSAFDASAADTGSALGAADAFTSATPSDPLAFTGPDASSFDLGQTGTNWFNTDPTIQSYATPDTTGAGTMTTSTGAGSTSGLPAGTPTVNASTTGSVAAPATSGGTVTGMGGTAGASSGGVTGTLNSIMSSPWTKLALGVAPLGVTLAMGEQQLPASAQQLQAQATALESQGLNSLASAQAGVLNSGQSAQIAAMQANLTNQWLQVLKNQGVADPTKDSRWPQIQALIDQQVTSATAQLVQQNITNALSETGQASSALTSIANMSMTADQNFTNNIINAAKSLGTAAGSSLPKITIG